ncbi:hypothetical protein MJO28_000064 [Puccinia striiformis f. sp. tritici]|uniref:Uncharacterized protein n=4 Tax=Puccinia striiformis TaxID=27350 RepID=A0A0L0UUQ4_9BASI|nr:hypothetical protein Pst134EA_001140 [Puccinia striiformis f. sp. tritici]KAI9626028.1 hypothetical protein H4Q26_016016 [Puccinia striiformis f. sp. tritici PST-130]KNE90777.1 hypothetical protein PSTG_15783 [Puccinia striiformis f. sp. tritici PST-78]POW11948.1 hypothetical protein PSHT_08241 [Puccinia striiformis]KAH9474093.1 hypothetical protein Pst134EA_001140 [Puccinia striiformis f. sp. tritici]KAI7961970.1 hypothetical protein MJO28_000064 [Puccinia striiformis f. sp. tritici]
MPPKSKQPARQTMKNNKVKTKARVHKRTSSPIDPSPENSGDDQESQDQSSEEETPRLDMKNLLKALENQSKQKSVKKQNLIFQEIESVLQEGLVNRLDNLIQAQETELEAIVSDYFTSKTQIEDQKDKVIIEIIKQQQSMQSVLKQLEDNLSKYIEEAEGKTSSTVQRIAQLDRQRKKKAHEYLNT